MKVSLILCTLGRDKELKLFLNSLVRQNYDDYELIIVDQNTDSRVTDILVDYNVLSDKLIHVRSLKGLSRARNVGLQHASGNIVGFPDDDCEYGDGILSAANDFFSNASSDQIVFCVNTCDPSNGYSLIQSPKDACKFDRNSMLGCSFTLFFTASILKNTFDERLGVGSGFIWGAAEEHDFMYRILGESGTGYFSPNLWVYHPAKENNTIDPSRAYYYGGGIAAFRCKNFTSVRQIKSAVLIIYQIFQYLLTGRWREAISRSIFLCGYLIGLIAWKIAIR